MFLENGAIAQLGERFNGIEEVVGSIPSGSTKTFNKIRSRSSRMLQLRSVSNRQLIATAARNGLWMSHPKTAGTRTRRPLVKSSRTRSWVGQARQKPAWAAVRTSVVVPKTSCPRRVRSLRARPSRIPKRQDCHESQAQIDAAVRCDVLRRLKQLVRREMGRCANNGRTPCRTQSDTAIMPHATVSPVRTRRRTV
jgi:hypothetical protein